MWEGIRAGFKQFLARQKASSAVSARKRELRDAEKHLQSMLDALYQRKYPPTGSSRRSAMSPTRSSVFSS
jgi:hypothetical protein